MDSMRISTVPADKRGSWNKVADWLKAYSEAEVVEMLHRYSDTQENAKAYRQRAADVNKLLKSAVAREAKAKGLSIVDYIKGVNNSTSGTRVDVTSGQVTSEPAPSGK